MQVDWRHTAHSSSLLALVTLLWTSFLDKKSSPKPILKRALGVKGVQWREQV